MRSFRSAAFVAALVLGGSACIDLEGAHQRCIDQGRCSSDAGDVGPSNDAGSEGAGGVDAGDTTDGGDELLDSGIPYDGGAPCNQSTNPRLECQVVADLTAGAKEIGLASLSAFGDRFLAGWRTGSTLEFWSVGLDGGAERIMSVDGGTHPQFAVATEGSRWALAYLSSPSNSLTCLTNTEEAGTSVSLPDGGLGQYVSIAVSEAGGVALAVNEKNYSKSFYGAQSAGGCPDALVAFPEMSDGTNNAAVAHGAASSSPEDLGFRFARTSQINYFQGYYDVIRGLPDGGVQTVTTPTPDLAPQFVSMAASQSGETLLLAYDQYDTTDKYTLGYVATSASLVGDGEPQILFDDPGYWWVTPCGNGCAAVANVMNFASGRPASVAFLSDDTSARKKGTWDAVCSLPSREFSDTSVATAYVAGKLGVFVTTRTSARVFVCRMPPL